MKIVTLLSTDVRLHLEETKLVECGTFIVSNTQELNHSSEHNRHNFS